MTVFLSTTDPGGAEELSADPTFLIKGPPDDDGRIIYYITRAMERYAVPAPADDNGTRTIAELFDGQPAGEIYLAARLGPQPQGFLPLAQTEIPPS